MVKLTLGIIGGGQLGSMLATAAKKLKIKTVVFCDDIEAPAQKFSDEFVYGRYDDQNKINEFLSKADVITFEFENGHVYILETHLFRVRNKKETLYCYSENEKQKNEENSENNNQNQSEGEQEKSEQDESQNGLDGDYDFDDYSINEQLVDTNSEEQSSEKVIQKINIDFIPKPPKVVGILKIFPTS